MKKTWLAFLLALSAAPALRAQELAPIIVEETSSSQTLAYDPIVTPVKLRVQGMTGNGSIQRRLSDELPFSTVDSAQPGMITQFRGLGRTVEDVNVQSLGVPLNYPQGGGFDLSVFPSYLWSGAQFQLGPQQGAYDAKSSSGTLTLIPWTDAALGSDMRGQGRASQLYARGLGQTAVGGRTSGDGTRAAALVGYSQGRVTGPSGSMSAALKVNESVRIRTHVLATRLEVLDSGSSTFPTPNGKQVTSRWIPVLQSEARLGSTRFLRTTAFYDSTRLDNDNGFTDALTRFVSTATPRQAGIELAYLDDDFRFGFLGRRVFYQSVSEDSFYGVLEQNPAPEWQTHLSLSRTHVLDRHWSWEPQLQGDWVEGGPGFRLGGGIGVRYDFEAPRALYARAAFTPRFASLVDRYFYFPAIGGERGFRGNPALEPERNVTAVLGYETRGAEARSRTEFFYQGKENLHARSALPSDPATFDTLSNSGRGRMFALVSTWEWPAFTQVALFSTGSFTDARTIETSRPYAYQPKWTGILGARVHDPEDRRWSFRLWARASTEFEADANKRLPGYTLVHADIDFSIGERFFFQLRLENLGDRRIEITRGYPLLGRVGALNVTAQL